MKKILVAVLMWPLLVLAQSYPSPTFNNLTVNGTLSNAFKNLSCANADAIGFNTTGSDNYAAFNSWFTSLAGKSGCLSFGAGTYVFSTRPSVTLASGQTLTIKGAGSDVTEVEFTGSISGWNFTYTQSSPDNVNGSSLNMGDMSLTTDGTTAVNPITITGNNTDNTHAKATYLWNLTVRPHVSAAYWAAGVNLQNVYQVTMDNYQYQGQTGQGATGYGILYNGPSSSAQGIVLNVNNPNIFNAGYGIEVTGYNQGINVVGGNIVDTGVGISCGNGATVGSQCSVTGVQIAAVTNCITANHVSPVNIVGNVCTIGTWSGSSSSTYAIALTNSTYASIGNNLIYIDTAGAGGVGSCIDLGNGNDNPATVTGNTLINCSTVYKFNSNSTRIALSGNVATGFTTYQTGLPSSISNLILDVTAASNVQIPGGTFTFSTGLSYSNPRFFMNDTSGTNAAGFLLQNNGTTNWSVTAASSSNNLNIGRYVSGTNVDSPISISNSTGLVSMADGLSVTGTVSGTGFSNYLASPPAIGGTSANSGAFTTLSASSTVSGSGFDNYITSANTRGLIDSMTNAKAYGALGNSNGTHGNGNDDTTALQNALNASANGVLHIPCGTYRITASISENSPTSNYWIMGDGECTKIYNDGATAFATFVFNPASANNNVNPTIKVSGIYFINPNVTGAGQAAVSFANEERPYFQNNIVYGYQQGVVYVSTFAPVIDHNTFHQLKGSAIDCSIDSSCNSGTIWQNGFFSGGIANSAPAINLNAPASGINGISIIGNDIEANYTGILFQNVSGAIVHGNYIENQTSSNLFFNSGNASIDFNGNWLGASPTLTLSNNLANSIFENNAIYNYTIGQGTSTSVRQINNTTTGTGSITVPSIGQLNSNTTSGTSMTSNTPVNCTSITLPAGTWDVSGSIQFAPAASTVISYMSASISPTSGTVGAQPNRTDIGGISATGSNVGSMSESTPVVRETFASSTPVYLVGNSVFTTSTMTCNGYIRAVLVQ